MNKQINTMKVERVQFHYAETAFRRLGPKFEEREKKIQFKSANGGDDMPFLFVCCMYI